LSHEPDAGRREHECAALPTHLANDGRVILVSGEAGSVQLWEWIGDDAACTFSY